MLCNCPVARYADAYLELVTNLLLLMAQNAVPPMVVAG